MPSIRFANWHRLSMAVHWRTDRFLGEESAISQVTSPGTFAIMGNRRYPHADLGGSTLSLAIEDEMKLFNRLKLAAGVSFDAQFFDYIKIRENQEFNDAYVVKDKSIIMGTRDSFNPVAGVVFDPVKRKLRLRAAAAAKTRFPTLGEYSKVEQAEMDRELKPERSYNVNSGAELFFNDKNISWRSDYFASIINNRIVKFIKG